MIRDEERAQRRAETRESLGSGPSVGRNLVSRRFRLLVEQLGDEYGRPARGWQSRVARALNMDRSYLAKVIGGEREVGVAAAQSAADALGIPLAFFTDPGEDRHFRSFVGSSKSRIERAQSVTHPDTLPLRDLMSAPPELQLVVLQHLAAKLGLAVVELPAATDLSSSLELAAKAQQESGEAVAALLRGLADGHLTREEGAELAREAREAVSANLALEQLGLAAQREGVIGLRVVGGAR